MELDRLRGSFGTATPLPSPLLHGAAAAVVVVDDDRRFAKPVAQMGDYHVQKSVPLRVADEIAASGKDDKPLFGNPFFALHKVSNRLKKDSLVIDESEDLISSPVRGKKHSPTRRASPGGGSTSSGSPPIASGTKRPSPENGSSSASGATKRPSPEISGNRVSGSSSKKPSPETSGGGGDNSGASSGEANSAKPQRKAE